MALPHIDDFLLHLQTDNYSNETIYNYERDLKVFENFLDEEIKIPFDKFDKHGFSLYKAHLSSVDRETACGNAAEVNKLSARSMNRSLSALRSFLAFLIAEDFPCPLPPNAVTLVRTERKHPRVAELSELIKLIEAPTHYEKNDFIAKRNRAMLEILFATGMRISELLSLRKEQLDGSGKLFIRGKGKKERFAYMTPRAQHHVSEYLKLAPMDNPLLFVPKRGKNANKENARISANYLQAKIKKYREMLGIVVPTSAHSLRHGFATYLAEQGANPAAIQILLGHESLETTTKYVHPSDRFAEQTHQKYHPLK